MRRILFSACFLILSAAVLGRAEEYEIKLGEEEDQYGVLVRSSEAVNIQGYDVTFTWTPKSKYPFFNVVITNLPIEEMKAPMLKFEVSVFDKMKNHVQSIVNEETNKRWAVKSANFSSVNASNVEDISYFTFTVLPAKPDEQE